MIPHLEATFFQNITSLHIPYFTIDYKKNGDSINLKFLNSFKTELSGKYIDWYSFKTPFSVIVDGSNGMGIINLPIPSKQIEVMDEEESSGI